MCMCQDALEQNVASEERVISPHSELNVSKHFIFSSPLLTLICMAQSLLDSWGISELM